MFCLFSSTFVFLEVYGNSEVKFVGNKGKPYTYTAECGNHCYTVGRKTLFNSK